MRIRRVVAECIDGMWHTMNEYGDIHAHASAEALVRFVKKQDQRAARSGVDTTTMLEWRNVPEGWEPPTP